jgi:hypothetical protein
MPTTKPAVRTDPGLRARDAPEGKWKGNACTGCNSGSLDTPAAGCYPQKRLVFMHLAHAVHRGRRFCIGK